MTTLIGATITFDDREPVWRELPAVPREGEVLRYDGRRYLVRDVTWHGTDTTWAVTIACQGENARESKAP